MRYIYFMNITIDEIQRFLEYCKCDHGNIAAHCNVKSFHIKILKNSNLIANSYIGINSCWFPGLFDDGCFMRPHPVL